MSRGKRRGCLSPTGCAAQRQAAVWSGGERRRGSGLKATVSFGKERRRRKRRMKERERERERSLLQLMTVRRSVGRLNSRSIGVLFFPALRIFPIFPRFFPDFSGVFFAPFFLQAHQFCLCLLPFSFASSPSSDRWRWLDMGDWRLWALFCFIHFLLLLCVCTSRLRSFVRVCVSFALCCICFGRL